MFINLSNHPSNLWSDNQLENAKQFGNVVDIPFPQIPASSDEDFINQLVNDYASEISAKYNPTTDVLHIMGEMCFSFRLIKELSTIGFTCLASTTERIVQDKGNGHKEAFFKFIRFRKYCL